MRIFNNQLPKQLNNFLIYLKTIKGSSQNTIDGYTSDLTTYFKFMKVYKNSMNYSEIDSIDISDIDMSFIKSITLSDIYVFMNYLEVEKSNKSQSRGRKVSSLKSFYNYLQTKEEVIAINENPTLKLEKPKVGKREAIYLELEECKLLLNAVYDYSGYYYYERDLCIITLFLHCGLRLDELRNINIEDIKNNVLSVVGKGNSERTFDLDKKSLEALNEWLKVRKDRTVTKEDENALFISKQGNRMDKKTIENMVKKYVEAAGLSKKYTPHKLRHTFCTLLVQSGANLRTVQEAMGHKNVYTTQMYAHVGDKEKKKALANNPLNDF